MLPAERRNIILDILRKEGKVEIEGAASLLDVSQMTIRRDLVLLEDQGLAYRTHGGAVLHNGLLREIPYKSKEGASIDEKRRIGRDAASLVQEGQIIILDSGTTTMEIAKAIKNIKNLTVITNDLKIALELNDDTQATVFCTGGLVQKGLGTLLGSTAENFLKGIRVDITFLAASSLDLKWGVTNPNLEKADLKRKMINAADKVILVADHTKFIKKAFAQVARIEEFDLIITDRGLDPQIREKIKDLGVNLRIV